MPNLSYSRNWCAECQEYTLFYYNFEKKKYCCKQCKSEFVTTELSEIPEEKQIEQRERYKVRRKQRNTSMLLSFSLGLGFAGTELLNTSGIDISEDDAGQNEIDKITLEKRKTEQAGIEMDYQKKVEYSKLFIGLGRNELCLCGSGKKYKKCCEEAISTFPINYR